MDILIQFLLLVLGFAMLVKGADWFVEGAAGIADKFGIPQLVIGLTIVAMGTSAPEAAVSITAALKGSGDITVGNVVGSNILNILVILGVTSAIVAVAVAKSTVFIEIPFMLGVTILFGFLGYTDGEINFLEGVILWVVFLIYLAYLFYTAKKDMNAQTTEGEKAKTDEKQVPVWKQLLLTIIGLVLIVLGSDVSVDAATEIATIAGLSERFIGLTIVALGTSLPELVTSASAALKGKADIAIGNIVGSNLFNILFVVGTSALITPIIFASNFMIDTMIAAAAGVLLFLCVFKTRKLTRPAGVIMLLGYAAYFVYLIK